VVLETDDALCVDDLDLLADVVVGLLGPTHAGTHG
jgi:hypothetical protein